MKIFREWIVVLTPDDMGESWPDTKLAYSDYVIRPDTLQFVITQSEDQPLKLQNPRVFGNRVLKSGRVGNTRHDRSYWQTDVLPDWVANAQAKATGLVATEVATRG